MVVRVVLSTCLSVAAAVVLAQTPAPQVPANPDLAAAQAGPYKVESNHMRVVFTVSHMGFSHWNGDFSGATGTLTFNPKDLSASVLDVTIPAASFATINADLDKQIKGKDWLDSDRYPSMHYVSKRIEKTGPKTARVIGDLTLHGVSKPVTLEVKFNGAGVNPYLKRYVIGFDGTAHIKRSDFGVNMLIPLVGDSMDVYLSGEFVKD